MRKTKKRGTIHTGFGESSGKHPNQRTATSREAAAMKAEHSGKPKEHTIRGRAATAKNPPLPPLKGRKKGKQGKHY